MLSSTVSGRGSVRIGFVLVAPQGRLTFALGVGRMNQEPLRRRKIALGNKTMRPFLRLLAGHAFQLRPDLEIPQRFLVSVGSDRRQALGQAGMQVLRERWPNYESDVGRTLFSFARRVLDWRLRVSQSSSPSRSPKPRGACT